LPIFLTNCKTTVYIYPEFIHPEIEEIPVNNYVDGGFVPVDGGLLISENDAKILAKYIVALKNWGSNGWTWITDYYIAELEKFKDKLPKEN
jgi:hypothetical protein